MRTNNAYIPFAVWAATVFASPPSSTDGCAALPPSDRITCNIQGWHTDIINVNGFIDSAQQAIDSSTPYNYPQEAVFSLGTEGKPCPAPNGCAWDEPVRLAGIEALIPASDSCGLKALAAVKATFSEVTGNLSAVTQADPSSIATIQDDLAALNVALCEDYLPAVAKLWERVFYDFPNATSVVEVVGPAACRTVVPGNY
ncbi:hypothetical protein KC332_g11587 [Hortaea werneckii]|nr:hypothetical protein KC350_g9825 [Hortaea werneckii]KAI6820997.1 hypothetical protein KC358_g9237 [Hortaea werneckii]KAI6918957.1 hypothetical protein KC348_g10764 [Hortaea werneckii]KAI6928701.1 hypothetical protein KC341_g11345 [Hortaea werneckii]KAI6964403.1 hypothetical protein KC321_g10689 [Hortaea werneckii]